MTPTYFSGARRALLANATPWQALSRDDDYCGAHLALLKLYFPPPDLTLPSPEDYLGCR
jgi:hypothetical protein